MKKLLLRFIVIFVVIVFVIGIGFVVVLKYVKVKLLK